MINGFIKKSNKKNKNKNHLPKLCLTIPIDGLTFNTSDGSKHIFISSLTGEESDNHDLINLNTKYLNSNARIIDKQTLKSQKYKSGKGGVLMRIFWLFYNFNVCISYWRDII